MRCGFRPHNRVWWVLSWFLGGFCCNTQMDFVDAQLTVGVPKDLQMERNLTGGIPRPLDKPRSIPRTLNTRSRNENKRGALEEVGVPDCKTDNGENARMQETNTYANAMHMMT